jgi:tetraprenyl-beta-curcumene synthase
MSPAVHTGSTGTPRVMRALALANARYWPTVLPVVHRELAAWKHSAAAIDDPGLRELALTKLRSEYFNAEVAATLATLAPRGARPRATEAIVALELLFDYLDGRTELQSEDPLGEGARLYRPFVRAVRESQPAQEHTPGNSEDRYLLALAARTREAVRSLPAAQQIADAAGRALARCAETQTRLHAAAALGDSQMQEWAEDHGRDSGLGWREYLAGGASSVLAVHALIAAAASPLTSPGQADRIDAAYLAIGGVITILDSVVDRAADQARGEPGFIRLFPARDELALRTRALIGEALARVREAPHSAHHEMTLAGVAAYYTTHPGAHDAAARDLVRMVQRELSPTIWPTLGVLRAWRIGKATRIRATCTRTRGARTGIPPSQRA